MDNKFCLGCGSCYKKHYHESKKSYAERKFCSRQCANNAKVGTKLSDEHKRKIGLAWTGRKHSLESIAKMSGKNSYRWKGGKPKCVDCGSTMSNVYASRCVDCYKKFAVGENSSHWMGGITPKNLKIRNSKQMKDWRVAVFERDNYTCQICSQTGGSLNAHHVVPFSVNEDLRFDVENGQTLCSKCHTMVHSGKNGIKSLAVIKAVAA